MKFRMAGLISSVRINGKFQLAFRSMSLGARTTRWPKPMTVHLRKHSSESKGRIVDLRSDTLTLPSKGMLQASVSAPLGDDVYGEDPTVVELETYTADLFGKEKGLFVPTACMANLLATMAHCHTRASEMIIGSSSHMC